MPITANVLYRDSFNFFRNQLVSILMLALLTASISVLLNQILGTDAEMLKILSATKGGFAASASMDIQEFIHKMTPEQQLMLLKASAAATFSALVGNALLIGGVLTLLRLVSQGQRTSALCAIGSAAPALPRLMLLLFICSLMIQLGLRLLVIPGVIMAIAFSLASVITTTDKKGVFASIKLSCRLAFDNVRVIVPAMVLWLVAKLLLFFVFSHLPLLTPNATNLVITALSNLISALLLIYLFRLYILLHS
ncbi:MAG: UPF0259 family protein [Serratia symbiotica]|nr:UPF0259 family protein [Serratia symbiotica]